MASSTAYLHPQFAARVQDWCKTMQHLRDEASRLTIMYETLTDSGESELFTNVEFATKADLQEAISVMYDLKFMFENGVVGQGWRAHKLAALLQ